MMFSIFTEILTICLSGAEDAFQGICGLNHAIAVAGFIESDAGSGIDST
jgi:hypothetical protein